MKYPTSRQLWLNINYLQRSQNIDNRKMAKAMGISLATFQNRKNKPQSTTLAELERASACLGVKAEDILKILTKGNEDNEID